jgi:hypothetical protein
MDKYTIVAASVRLHSGVLSLTKEQAATRLHNLKALDKGHYEIVQPVEFKRGETIGYDGEISKAMGEKLVRELTAKEKKAAEAKAAAEKKAAEEAEAKAKAEAEAQAKAEQEAREAAEAEAKATWEGSDELKAQFPEFALYLESLEASSGAGK